jgi:hypothetical protein
MAVTMFQLLLKYHDPTLANHLGMEGGKESTNGGCGVTSYLIPHSWLFGGFLDECGRRGEDVASASSSRRLSCQTLSMLWDYMIVDSNPMFSWFLLVRILVNHRSQLLALPNCLHGIISKQRSNTERMRVEIRAIVEDVLLSSPSNSESSSERKQGSSQLGVGGETLSR